MASNPRVRIPPPPSVSSDDDLIDIQHTGTTNSDRSYGTDGETVENGTSSTKTTGWFFGEEIPGLGQYDDFHTIDWQRDIARDRMRHRYQIIVNILIHSRFIYIYIYILILACSGP